MNFAINWKKCSLCNAAFFEIDVAKDISLDATVVADLSELDIIFAIKEKPKMALLFFVDEIFVGLSDVLAFPLTDFGV